MRQDSAQHVESPAGAVVVETTLQFVADLPLPKNDGQGTNTQANRP